MSVAGRAGVTATPARAGVTLRAILLAPGRGFAAASRRSARRAGAAERVPEGASPFVLGFFGGAALMVLWLKLSSLIGAREVAAEDFRWDLFAAALIGGGIATSAGQLLWGVLGRTAARLLGGRAERADLRFVWGTSAFPTVLVVALTLPLDLAIVGTEAFASERLGDPVSTAWAAFSVALAVSAGVWSLFLFGRGTEVVAGLSPARAVAATVIAAICLAAVVGVLLGVALLFAGAAT